jgi:hypothetical protein
LFLFLVPFGGLMHRHSSPRQAPSELHFELWKHGAVLSASLLPHQCREYKRTCCRGGLSEAPLPVQCRMVSGYHGRCSVRYVSIQYKWFFLFFYANYFIMLVWVVYVIGVRFFFLFGSF